MKGERIASTPITPKQQRVLELVRDWFGGDMAAAAENYRQIADEMGWKQHGSVVDVLFKLRAKGALHSVGCSMTRPERWRVTP